MRRRALLAVQNLGANSNNWAYELHLTPEWQSMWGVLYVDVYDDFSEVFELLTRMLQTIGTFDEFGGIYIEEIPEEVNITVDGKRLSKIEISENTDFIAVSFGDFYYYGSLYPTQLSLNRRV